MHRVIAAVGWGARRRFILYGCQKKALSMPFAEKAQFFHKELL